MKILNILFFRELVVPSPYPHIIIFFYWKILRIIMRLSMKCLYDEVNPGLCHVKINQSYVPCPPATTRLSYHPSFVLI